jgi:xylulokinase
VFLGLDLGTSELKALLLDEEGRIAAESGAPLTLSHPRPLWSEQSPEDWTAALFAALDRLAAEAPRGLAAVRAIGLSGQMHGAVLLDAADRPLRPAILWNDGRSAAECAALEAAVPEARAITGNRVMPGFTAPKLLWVRRHEPEIFARIRSVLLPKDYLRLVLTGEKATDCSDASGTSWLDVGARRWSERLLAATGLDLSHVPRLLEGSAPSGVLRPELARRWGMGAGVIVAAGGGDNAASAVGLGLTEPGEGFLSLGTSGVIFAVSEGFRPCPETAVHAFCHALPGRWHQMSVMLSAAGSLAWASRALGRPIPALLEAAAALGAAGEARAPLFLPYLSGERTPHDDPALRGAFLGLSDGHGAGDLAYAVLEGVGFGLRDGLAALGAAGPLPAALVLCGGGARSPFWAELLADILGLPLRLADAAAGGAALGAARLGALAAGGTLAEMCRPAPVVAEYRPDPARAARLAQRYALFRAALPAGRALPPEGVAP